MNINEFDRARHILINYLLYQPKVEVLRELEVVIERLQFIPGMRPLFDGADQPQVQSTLSFLFQQEISRSMLLFLAAIAQARLGYILLDEQGQEFLRQCRQYYDGLPEIRIISAVPLSAGFQQQLAMLVLQNRSQSARVVYEVLPSLVGGCLIVDTDGKTYDYSFKTNITFYARQFLERKLEEIRR